MISSAFGSPTARPNVLFIMADDFWSDQKTGLPRAKTPHLDRLAKRALTFDRAYCQQAVCNPSRSSLLTGLRPDTLRLWNNGTHFRELNPAAMTLPLWFKLHGYHTRGIGKIFHNWHTQLHGDPQSWSEPEFLHYANHGDDIPQIAGTLPRNHANANTRRYGNTLLCESRDVPDTAYYDGRVAAEAERVLQKIAGGPFFLGVGFWKPHAPFNAPKKYWDLYERDRIAPPDFRRPDGAPDIAFHDSREILGPPDQQSPLTTEQIAEIRHGYLANISYLDAQLGKVLDALDRSGVADRTLIVLVSDHGYQLGEHTLFGKNSNFEFDARAPLFIATPDGSSAGQHTQALTELIDLFPTLVELCGLPVPDGLDGISLAPLLKDPTRVLQPAAFTQHPRPAFYDREPTRLPQAMGYSVRTASVRFTEWRDWLSGKIIGTELYATEDDPAESRNRFNDSFLLAQQLEAIKLLHQRFPLRAP